MSEEHTGVEIVTIPEEHITVSLSDDGVKIVTIQMNWGEASFVTVHSDPTEEIADDCGFQGIGLLLARVRHTRKVNKALETLGTDYRAWEVWGTVRRLRRNLRRDHRELMRKLMHE